MPLFEVAIIEVPTKKEVEEGTSEEKLVFGPSPIIARDASMAGIKVVMANREIDVNQSKMQVLVRPFG